MLSSFADFVVPRGEMNVTTITGFLKQWKDH